MRRDLLVAATSVVLLALLALGRGHAAGAEPDQATGSRLVVFEYFDSTCPTCVEAGTVVEALAQEYGEAGRPVEFIEYGSSDYLGNRLDRWYQACPNWRACYLPLELVDSGWRWSCGPKDYRSVYVQYIDAALANPAGADLVAAYTRDGAELRVRLRVTNRAGRSIGPENDATLNVIVYEHVRVLNTGRFARAADAVALPASLADGAQGEYEMRLAAPRVGQWDRAVVLAVLDHRPDPLSEVYASLQAAIAVEGALATPTDPASPTTPATRTSTPTASPGPSPTPSPTPVWLDPPRFVPLAVRPLRSR